MAKSTNTTTNTGIGFGGALFITFLVLKLTGVIDWSWWWISAPLWIPAGICVIGLIIFLVGLIIDLSKKLH